ncbi:MAG: NUDIX domain-containing protein [Prevotella sp.]|nr:NUDIX domain-containing protein [Prevotella sp.]
METTEHPLIRFAYCPLCGSREFEVNNFKSKKCGACGFTYYANPCSATAAFILRGSELLVARRGKEPARGTLDLPGGFVDMEETVEEGMRREIREETGLEATAMSYLFSLPNRYLYSGMVIHTLDMFYQVEVAAGAEPTADDDAAELFWVPLSEVRPELFGLASISRGVARFLQAHSKG